MNNRNLVLVSVLIPVYNCQKYIKYTLDSLIKQTMTDFEVILVNDGSTDDSLEIINTYAMLDSRFKVFTQNNMGIVSALNFGLSKAVGKYIARLDGDDIAHPERLKRQYDFMESNDDCVCVGSLYRAIDSFGNVIWSQKVFSNVKQTNLLIYPPYVTTFPHPSVMIRARDYLFLNGYRSCFPHAEDYDFFLRLSRLGRFEILPFHLLLYRIHQSSITTKYLDIQLDSALKALLSAILVKSGLKDPYEIDKSTTLDEVLNYFPEHRSKIFYTFLSDLRLVGGWLNRGEFGNASASLRKMAFKLKSQRGLLFDSRYWCLIKSMVRMFLKIKLKKI